MFKKFSTFFIVCLGIVFVIFIFKTKDKQLEKNILGVKETNASYQFSATGGALVAGTEIAPSVSNVGSWRGTLGNDSATNGSGNYWQVAKVNPGGLDLQLNFDNVELYGANKMIITLEDSMITTGDAFTHQICDWTSSVGVDVAADGVYCTGGGWRTLNPRKLTYTSTSDTTRQYEIYDGYFSDRASTPGAPLSTSLSNFVRSSDKRVLIRTYSSVASTVNYRIDFAQVEVAIDPVYEPAEFVKTTGGTTVNYYSDLFGAIGTNVVGSDGNKMTIPMPSISNPADFYFKFKNVKKYTGANTILISPEICVSNVALTFGIYVKNFVTDQWTQVGTNITGTACTTDTDYAISFNSTSNPGIDINDYISSGNEIHVRFLTNAPSTVYNMQLDRLYIMLGSVNVDNSQCEISWGTGTASDCQNTRDVRDSVAAVATASTNTWSNTAVLEYPNNYHALDNDDDTTNAEYATSANIDFPITVSSAMSVTAIHYATRHRSNVTTMTSDLQMKNYASLSGLGGDAVGPGWTSTPGADSNALTTYSYVDSWRVSELQTNPEDHINTVTNEGNLRLRTSASTNTTVATARNWDFAMMSIRWVEREQTGVLGVDIVNSSGVAVSTPSISMSGFGFSFADTVSNSVLGSADEKIRVDNASSNAGWALSISAFNGPTALWEDGIKKYDFNDPTSSVSDGPDSDSYGGQMTFNPSSGSLTPKSGCANTGLTLGSLASFSEGVVNSINLVNASSNAGLNCYWDLTGVDVSQSVPGEQIEGNYSISLMLSVIAN